MSTSQNTISGADYGLEPTPSDRQGILILLQYHLHKLYVLSIYHPARGFDLSPANISSFERHELLISARAVLRLRQDDASIWSNWDLVVGAAPELPMSFSNKTDDHMGGGITPSRS